MISSQITVSTHQTEVEQLQKNLKELNQELPGLQKELAAAQLQKRLLERKLATAQEPFSILTKKAEKPIKPKKRLNVMLAGAVRLMVTVFLAFFLEYLQTAALKKEPWPLIVQE